MGQQVTSRYCFKASMSPPRLILVSRFAVRKLPDGKRASIAGGWGTGESSRVHGRSIGTVSGGFSARAGLVQPNVPGTALDEFVMRSSGGESSFIHDDDAGGQREHAG